MYHGISVRERRVSRVAAVRRLTWLNSKIRYYRKALGAEWQFVFAFQFARFPKFNICKKFLAYLRGGLRAKNGNKELDC